MKEFKSLTNGELIDLVVNGQSIPATRVLATFADPNNWVQIYNGENHSGYNPKPCEWAFIGPVSPPYELAQKAMEDVQRKIEQEGNT